MITHVGLSRQRKAIWVAAARRDHGCVRSTRSYPYVGPSELRTVERTDAVRVDSARSVAQWLATREVAARAEPFTFVVDLDCALWLAPRQSEHVACAEGRDVLAAGEMGFAHRAGRWVVT